MFGVPEMHRKVGDIYPPICFVNISGDTVDMRGYAVAYYFVPDNPRNKARGGKLRPKNLRKGIFHAPRPRTPGVAELTVHWPNGWVTTEPSLIRWVL